MKRTLIAGGTILTLDGRLGDLPRGDLLIEDERIAAVAPSIDGGDAERIDCHVLGEIRREGADAIDIALEERP